MYQFTWKQGTAGPQSALLGGLSRARVRGVARSAWTGLQSHSPPTGHSCVAQSAQPVWCSCLQKWLEQCFARSQWETLSLPVIVIIISGDIAFRAGLSSNHSDLDQRIQVNVVLLIMFAKASESIQVSRCTSIAVLLTWERWLTPMEHLTTWQPPCQVWAI